MEPESSGRKTGICMAKTAHITGVFFSLSFFAIGCMIEQQQIHPQIQTLKLKKATLYGIVHIIHCFQLNTVELRHTTTSLL